MLKKLANGEYSLKIIFWVFGLFGFFVFYVFTSITHAGVLRCICPMGQICSQNLIWFIASNFIGLMMRGTQSGVMLYLVSHILLSASFAVYMYLTLRGVWKAAATYEGSAFWKWSAKILLVLLAVLSFKSIF